MDCPQSHRAEGCVSVELEWLCSPRADVGEVKYVSARHFERLSMAGLTDLIAIFGYRTPALNQERVQRKAGANGEDFAVFARVK